MTKLRTLAACARAQVRTQLRARCIIRVGLTEQNIEQSRRVLDSVRVRRPL